MPSGDIYRCKWCNEESLILPKYFTLSPFPQKWVSGPPKTATREERDQRKRDIKEWTRRQQQTFVCDPCELMLFLPRQIDAVTWSEWKRADLLGHQPHAEYPFLVTLARRIDGALTAKRECVMDFGELSCPYCSRLLISKDELSPKCKRCGSSDLEHVDSGIATMSASFPHPWPPIA